MVSIGLCGGLTLSPTYFEILRLKCSNNLLSGFVRFGWGNFSAPQMPQLDFWDKGRGGNNMELYGGNSEKRPED